MHAYCCRKMLENNLLVFIVTLQIFAEYQNIVNIYQDQRP